jgi:hypothetical protein
VGPGESILHKHWIGKGFSIELAFPRWYRPAGPPLFTVAVHIPRSSPMKLDPELILEHLWHAPERPYPPKVWAVLDAARDPGVLRWLRASGLECASLYSGPVPPELEAVAPYLVRLLRREPATRELIESAWGNSWGIFLSADLMIEPLRRHLRHFLRVQDETGRKLLFRFYDPRVLRVYLPVCNAHELWLFFGAIEQFMIEGDDPQTLLRCRLVERRLEQSDCGLSQPAEGGEQQPGPAHAGAATPH